MLNGADVNIRLTRSKHSFCLMTSPVSGACKLVITNALLFVKKVQVAPAVFLEHAEVLLTANAKYVVDGVGMKLFSIPSGSCVSKQENMFMGQTCFYCMCR